MVWARVEEILKDVVPNTYRIQRDRVRSCIHRLFGQQIVPQPIRRREYHVRAPLAVVHIDGHHKLIRY